MRRKGTLTVAPHAVPRRRDRRPRRHADDCEGPRFPERHARRRHLGRRRVSAWPISARPSGRSSCSRRWPDAPGAASSPATRSSRRLYPDHYSIQLACRQDYPAFYERELQFRRAMRYPPLVALINTVVRARTFAGAMDDAADVAQKLRESDVERARADGAWSGAAADRPPARRVSRPAARQGSQPPADAGSAAGGGPIAAGSGAGGRPSTSIR